MSRRFDHLGDVETFVTVVEKGSMTAGAVMAGDLSPQKARLLLMLQLHRGVTSKAELQAAFDR